MHTPASITPKSAAAAISTSVGDRQCDIRVERLGYESLPIAIIDNFADEPDRLIASACEAHFEQIGEFYPGPRARAPAVYMTGVASIVAPVVSALFGVGDSLRLDRALFSIATTPPKDLTLAQRLPHIDSVNERAIAIIHYLSKNEFGGTAFYRHRATGFESVSEARHARYLDQLKSDILKFGEPSPAYIAGDTPLFEQIGRVEAKFNRAVIYRSNQLHCAILPNDALLPVAPREGRLTIASFLTIQ